MAKIDRRRKRKHTKADWALKNGGGNATDKSNILSNAFLGNRCRGRSRIGFRRAVGKLNIGNWKARGVNRIERDRL